MKDWAEHHGKPGPVLRGDRQAPRGREDGRRATSRQLNERLNRWESIKKWMLLDHDLTIESGELTPSMKVKRKVVENNYKDLIGSLYS